MLISNLPSASSLAQLAWNSDVRIYIYLYVILHFKRHIIILDFAF